MGAERTGNTPTRVMFLYWGRRGLTQFAVELMRAAQANTNVDATISVSRQNEDFARFTAFKSRCFPVDTFETSIGAISQAWRIPLARQRLTERLRSDRTQLVVDLMPHVWTPFLEPVIRAAGARYRPIVHDADVHPGDYRTWLAKGLLDRSMRHADVMLTMSEAVADRLAATGRAPRSKIRALFHPDLQYVSIARPRLPNPPAPLKLIFFGRIMAYKGLDLFLDAVDVLRAEGLAVKVGVFGEGALGANASRLVSMDAEVVNRWVSNAEVEAILPRFHAMVLSYTEASQSGVAAMALGAGLPIVATPVGGLIEQIEDGVTGVLAARTDAESLAKAVKRLLLDPVLYAEVYHNICKRRGERSMARFIDQCVSAE
jgi:glycosyltransferase involved in cell wall biosynthesis